MRGHHQHRARLGQRAPELRPRAPAAPGSSAYIGDPCERNSVGMRFMAFILRYQPPRAANAGARYCAHDARPAWQPSATSVACTCGRAATRAWNCCSEGHGDRSTLSVADQFSDREQVGVGDGERVARQVRLRRQRLRDVVEALGQRGALLFLRRVGRVRIPERSELLVDFRADEVEPFHHAIARKRAVRRRQRAGLLVGDVLEDHGDLGQPLAVVQVRATARSPSD